MVYMSVSAVCLTPFHASRPALRGMKHLSLRLDDDLLDDLEAEAADRDLSRSEYIRMLLAERPAAGRVDVDDLQAVARQLRERERDLEAAEARRDELRRQLAAVTSREREHQELVEYVEEEREMQRRREQRKDAPVWRRLKWWVFGRGSDGDGAE